MMIKRELIQGFIQNIYAFVIGFGFFQIKVTDINFSSTINWEIIFNILLYLFTFIIAAHDWLEFHKKDLPDDISIFRSLPQMMSLLSVGFMFLHSTYSELLLWTIGGVSLTFWNLIGILPIKKTESNWYWWPSFILIAIALIITWLVYSYSYSKGKMVSFTFKHVIFLVILQLFVYGIWILKYHCYGKGKEKEIKAKRSGELQNQLEQYETLYKQLVAKYGTDISNLSHLYQSVSSKIGEMEALKASITQKIAELKAQIPKG